MYCKNKKVQYICKTIKNTKEFSMKELNRYEDIQIPTWALSYIFNGDLSGIDDKDREMADKFSNEWDDEVKQQDGDSWVIDCDLDDVYFTWNPEFGLACDVVDCTIIILGEE
jgi:hypothetical protein